MCGNFWKPTVVVSRDLRITSKNLCPHTIVIKLFRELQEKSPPIDNEGARPLAAHKVFLLLISYYCTFFCATNQSYLAHSLLFLCEKCVWNAQYINLKGFLEVLLPRITCGLNPQAWALTHFVIRLLQIRLWKQPFPLDVTTLYCLLHCDGGNDLFLGIKQWHSLCSASTKTRRTLYIHAIQSPTHFVLCCVKKESFNFSAAAATVFAENMLFIIITNQKVTIVPLRVLLNRGGTFSVNMLHVLLHA